jgi:hypothetical protein
MDDRNIRAQKIPKTSVHPENPESSAGAPTMSALDSSAGAGTLPERLAERPRLDGIARSGLIDGGRVLA